MEKCHVCHSRIVFGGKERAGEFFCGDGCLALRFPPQFCTQCLADTTDQGPGDLGVFLFFGFELRVTPGEPPCPTCGSRAAQTWHTILSFAVSSMEWYRVLSVGEKLVARELRVQECPPRPAPQRPWLDSGS